MDMSIGRMHHFPVSRFPFPVSRFPFPVSRFLPLLLPLHLPFLLPLLVAVWQKMSGCAILTWKIRVFHAEEIDLSHNPVICLKKRSPYWACFAPEFAGKQIQGFCSLSIFKHMPYWCLKAGFLPHQKQRFEPKKWGNLMISTEADTYRGQTPEVPLSQCGARVSSYFFFKIRGQSLKFPRAGPRLTFNSLKDGRSACLRYRLQLSHRELPAATGWHVPVAGREFAKTIWLWVVRISWCNRRHGC